MCSVVAEGPSRPASASEGGRLRVVVNGRFLSQRLSGVQRYAREIVSAIDALHTSTPEALRGLEFELVTPPAARSEFPLGHIHAKPIGSLAGNLWEQISLPRYASGSIVLNLANAAPLLAARQVVTLHDAAPWRVPEAYSLSFGAWYRAMLPRVAARAELVLTVSESAASDLQRFVLAPGRKPIVTLEGSDHVLRVPSDRMILGRVGLAEDGFLLCIANRHPAKNIGLVAEAFAHPSMRGSTLVVVGASDPRIFRDEAELSTNGRVVQLQGVSDSELRGLLETAQAVICPSRYEGFGLPPLEALACGCPVVASSIPAHREVLGDAALFFEDGNPGALVAQLRRLLRDPDLRADLQARGRARAQQFRWTDAAMRVVGALRQLRRRAR